MDAHSAATPAVTGPSRLSAFVERLRREVDQHGGDNPTFLASAADALRALVAHDDWLDERYAEPHPEHGQQYLLHREQDDRFSIVSVVWGPGHHTPVHNHTVWGLVGQLRGAEIEETFSIAEGRPRKTGEARLIPGQVSVLSPRAGDVHRVRNAFADRTSISIHVYGGDIGALERHIFTPEGDVLPFRTGYANAPISDADLH